MDDKYKIPAGAGIGHVHLKVAHLEVALDFYCRILGFEITMRYGKDAAFVAAGGYHHHIGLNTWYSKDQPVAPVHSPGLFHISILYPERKNLAAIYRRLLDFQYPLTGAADHGVSEALYLNDPDKNGVELYWDRPVSHWPTQADGSLDMYTRSLDLDALLEELAQ